MDKEQLDDLTEFWTDRLLRYAEHAKKQFSDDNVTGDKYWNTVDKTAQLATVLLALQGLRRPAVPSMPPVRKRALEMGDGED
jgi:hypothetical protein